jgi:hypothetical protein
MRQTNPKPKNSLYGEHRPVYYVYAPRWIDSSAGIKVLHYLCHALNIRGQEAFVVLTDVNVKSLPRVNPNLQTPILTKEQALSHFQGKRNPIVIYSETVNGNPLNAANVVRYLLNYPGALGGAINFPEEEFIVSFSENIARSYEKKTLSQKPNVLFLPPVDFSEFTPQDTKESFQLVYAGKYRSFIGAPPKVGNLPSIEIMREGKDMQSRSEVKKLLSEARVLYCFENSSIITESILSGTPVILVRNEFFREVIAEHEVGWGGTSFYGNENAYESAVETLSEGIERYRIATLTFWAKLDEFIDSTQGYFATSQQLTRIDFKAEGVISLKHKLTLGVQILKSKGVFTFVRAVSYHVSKRIWLRLRSN